MFEWIISSTVLTAVIIALRFVLKGKISPRLQYALWALVLIRLLLPFSIGSSSLSVMNQVEYSSTYQERTSTVTVITPGNTLPGQPAGNNTAPPLSGTQSPAVTVPGTTPSAGQTAPEQPTSPPAQEAPTPQVDESSGIWTLLRLVWLGGSILLGVWFAMTNLLFFLRIKKSRTPNPFSCKLPVYVCGAVDTPCLFGFFRPAVYLTEDVASDERTVRHAVEHEMTHYYHKDHIWAVLRCVCLAVHWFNPLVWYAAFLSRNDAELACDDSTIRRLGESERAEYGRTLLRLTCEKRTAILHTATTMTGSGRSIKERIALIVKRPKMAVYTLIAVLLIAAVAIVCTFTGAKDKSNETNTQLWPEDAIISCARFEYAGDNGGYKLITSEIAQFNSLRSMNLIPVEGEFTGDIIYRLILNWNEVSKGAKAYIILVSEESLSVNGQLFQPDGFDFSEILAYFEGKYAYFDYELLYDTEQDNGDENNTEIPEDIAYLLDLLETLKPEDITGYSANMQADTEMIVPLINAAAKTYAGEIEMENMAEWIVDLHLTERRDDPLHSPELISFLIDTREGIVDVLCRLDADSDPSDYVNIRLHSTDLWNYIFSLYNINDIDQNALAVYEDILAERSRQTMEYHNSSYVPEGFPAFTGFEIRYLRLVDSFDYGRYLYKVYGWDAGFLTDDPDPSHYGWPQDGWVDDQNRVINYEWCRVFVAAWGHDEYEYEFTNWGICEPSHLYMRAQIIKDFTGEEVYLEGEPVYQEGPPITSKSSLYTCKGVSIEIPNNLYDWIEVHKGSDNLCEGLVMNPTYYSPLPEQTLFSLHHTCEYWENGDGLIFSIRRYTKDEYQQYYLNSYGRQQVFAKDDNYYYCVFIPARESEEDAATAAILEELVKQQINKILPDMIERNGWQAYNGENDGDSTLTDEQIRANAIVKNFASLKAEDIKQIPGFIGTDYSDVAVLLNDLEEYMVEPFESDQSFWSLTLYLSGGPEEFNHRTDENLTIYAYGEESRLQIQYHSKLGVSTRIYFDYPALHQYIRQQYHTDHVIDEEALALYRDIVTARAEYTMDVRNSNYDEAKFIGYEVMTFHQIGTFERDGIPYEVYELEIAFITDNTDYPWAMNRVWVDSELHIRSYDSYPYLVVRSNGTKTEHDFFPWDTPLYGYDWEYEAAYDEIAANFVPENSNGAYNIYTADNCSIALPGEWNMLLVNPAESFYLSDQTLFAVFHEGEYLSLGLGWIFSIQRYTEEEFLPLYLNSPSRQYVFAKDDSYYYCVLLPSDVQSEHPGISAFMEDIRTNQLSPILTDMIERNGWERFSNESAAEMLPVLTLSDTETNTLCTAVMNNLKTGWWKGGVPFEDCTYEAGVFECVYRRSEGDTERFFGYAYYFRFDENGNCVDYWGAPSIITTDSSVQSVYSIWWPGDGAAYVDDILTYFPEEIAWAVAEPPEGTYQMIRDRLMAIAKAQISQVTEADAATRLANLTVGDIKYFAGFSEVDASEIVSLLSAAAGKIIERTEEVMSFWSLELYLSGGPDVYNTGTDEWLTIYAGMEENIVQINHHSKNGKYTILYFEDEALYKFVRGTYTTDEFIDEEAFGRFGDILEDRAQETVDRSKEYEGGYPLPYTGFKIVGFEKVDSFERDGTKYEVYEWDVAFLHDDPMKVGWAGGMWLDSELRVRALEQETYFVVRISGDTVAYDFFFWDLYFGPDEATGRENAIDAIIKRFSDLEN